MKTNVKKLLLASSVACILTVPALAQTTPPPPTDVNIVGVTGGDLASQTTLANVEGLVTTTNTELSAINGLITTSNTELAAVNTALGTANGYIDQIETLIGTSNTELASVNTNLGTTNAELLNVQSEIQTTNSELVTANGHLFAIESDIALIEGSTASTATATANTESLTEETRDAVRQTNSLLTAQKITLDDSLAEAEATHEVLDDYYDWAVNEQEPLMEEQNEVLTDQYDSTTGARTIPSTAGFTVSPFLQGNSGASLNDVMMETSETLYHHVDPTFKTTLLAAYTTDQAEFNNVDGATYSDDMELIRFQQRAGFAANFASYVHEEGAAANARLQGYIDDIGVSPDTKHTLDLQARIQADILSQLTNISTILALDVAMTAHSDLDTMHDYVYELPQDVDISDAFSP